MIGELNSMARAHVRSVRVSKRNYDEILRKGLEQLHRELDCNEALQTQADVVLPYRPLAEERVKITMMALQHAVKMRELEILIASNMSKWPMQLIDEWRCMAEEQKQLQPVEAEGKKDDGNQDN
jgi:hypothetical protein